MVGGRRKAMVDGRVELQSKVVTMSLHGPEKKLTLWLVLILLFVVLGTWLSRRELKNIIRNDDDVIHSYDVLDSLSDTISLMKDAETGERGYLITGSEIYLQPYEEAVSSINQHVQQLKTLTAGDPVAAPLVALLAEHIATKLGELSESINLRRRVSFEAAQALVLTEEGKRTMDAACRTSSKAMRPISCTSGSRSRLRAAGRRSSPCTAWAGWRSC